jgi:glycosyltransferase involved in cell wall biosynthesis
VVPNGVNVDQYYPRFRENHGEGSKKFRFLFVGGTIWRKGVDILLHAYRRAFGSRDNVVLIIKDFPQGLLYADQGIARIISEIRKDGDAPEIVHYNELLDLEKMPGLYSACDCLVHPYRGEGFGLPVLEAMACGIPVITTEGGSTDDFCSSEHSYLIPSKRVDFTPSDLKLAGGAGWLLEPDLDSLTSILREVYENGKEAKEKAMKASAFVRANFDWKKIGEKVMERLDLLIQRPIRRNGARR